MIILVQLGGAFAGCLILMIMFDPEEFNWNNSEPKIAITISLIAGALLGGQIYLGFK